MGYDISVTEDCSLMSEMKRVGGLSDSREVESFLGVSAGFTLCLCILCDSSGIVSTEVSVRSTYHWPISKRDS